MKISKLIHEIGFGDRLSKSVDDVTMDKFEDFGVFVGSLYQKFKGKDLREKPAIAQKILDLVSVEDDSILMNQIKDLEYLINQLPDKPSKPEKIGFRTDETWRPKGENPDKGAELKTNKIKLKDLTPESYHPINSPIDLIDKDILDIPDGSVGEIKKAAAKLGIDPQNKYESELRDEIENLLTSPRSAYEEYELVKKYFGDYADELMHQHGLKMDEVNENSGVIDKIIGGIPYRYEGDGRTGRAIISEPLDDNTKTRIIKRAEQAGYIAKPNMAGGVTIFIKEDKLSEDDEFEKAKEADRLEKHPEKDKIKKIQQMMDKEKNEEHINGFDYHYRDVVNAKRPRMVNESSKKTLQIRAGIIK